MYFNIAKEILQLSLRGSKSRGNLILGATHWDCFTAFAMTGFLRDRIACCERSEGIFFTPRDDTESHHVGTMPNVKK